MSSQTVLLNICSEHTSVSTDNRLAAAVCEYKASGMCLCWWLAAPKGVRSDLWCCSRNLWGVKLVWQKLHRRKEPALVWQVGFCDGLWELRSWGDDCRWHVCNNWDQALTLISFMTTVLSHCLSFFLSPNENFLPRGWNDTSLTMDFGSLGLSRQSVQEHPPSCVPLGWDLMN